MTIVGEDAIEDAWLEIYDEGITDPELQAMVERFAQEQPILLAYLMSVEDDIPDEDDAGFLFLYGVWAWLAFEKAGRSHRQIKESEVDAAHHQNVKEMAELDAAGPAMSEAVAARMTGNYRQMPLLSAILTEIMEGELEGTSRLDDMSGICLLHMKTVIDCLDD